MPKLNVTETILCTGDWQAVAGPGALFVANLDYEKPLDWAWADAKPTADTLHRFPAAQADVDGNKEMIIPTERQFWIKGRTGQRVAMTAAVSLVEDLVAPMITVTRAPTLAGITAVLAGTTAQEVVTAWTGDGEYMTSGVGGVTVAAELLVDGSVMANLSGTLEAGSTYRIRETATATAAPSVMRETDEATVAEVAPSVIAPTVANMIADRSFTQGAGTQQIATAGAFGDGGGVLAFAVTGSGLTIDANNGEITAPINALGSVTATVTATNSAGAASTSFDITVVAVSADPDPVFHRQAFAPQTDYVEGADIEPYAPDAYHPNGRMIYTLDYFRVDGVDRSGDLVEGKFDTSGEGTAVVTFRYHALDPVSGNFVYSDEVTCNVAPYAQPATILPWAEASSVVINGFTYNFSAPVLIAEGAPGHFFVKTDRQIRVTSKLPATQSVNGYLAYGMMWRPSFIKDARQGWDAMLAVRPSGTSDVDYASALNVDPANTGSDFVVEAGEVGDLVATGRTPSASVNGQGAASWGVVPDDGWSILTFVNVDPPENAFRPAVLDAHKTTFVTTDDIDAGFLQNLPGPTGPGVDSAATYHANIPDYFPFLGDGGESLRRFSPTQSMSSSNYASDYSGYIYEYCGLLNTDHFSPAEKALALQRMVSWAIQIYGAVRAGWRGQAGAGQGHLPHVPAAYGAFAIGSADMLNLFHEFKSNLINQVFWVKAEDVGAGVFRGNPRFRQAFLDGHVSESFWLQEPPKRRFQHSSLWRERYLVTSNKASHPGVTAMGLLQGGPGAVSGTDLLISGPDDLTNDRAAVIDFYDRYAAMNYNIYNASSPGATAAEMYNRYRAGFTPARKNFRPSQPDPTGNEFTAIAGGVAFDLSDHDGSFLPITRYDLRYSLNGYQWIEALDVGVTGDLLDLLHGTEYYVQFRLTNSAGSSEWSVNFPYNAGDPERGLITTLTGTPPATSNEVLPQVMLRDYPLFPRTTWKALQGAYAGPDVVFGAGLGDWRGGAGRPAVQWFEDGAPVDGATDDRYTRTAIEAVEIYVEATKDGITVQSPTISLPALAVDPNVLFESQFDATFPLLYPDVFNNIEYNNFENGKTGHTPDEVFLEVEIDTPGAMRLERDGSYPFLGMPLPDTAPGTEYEVTVTCVGNVPDTLQSTLQFRIGYSGNQGFEYMPKADGGGFSFINTNIFPSDGAIAKSHTWRFAAHATQRNLWASIRMGTNTQGTGGDDGHLVYLKIVPVG